MRPEWDNQIPSVESCRSAPNRDRNRHVMSRLRGHRGRWAKGFRRMTALPTDVVADLRQENAQLRAELRAARDRQAGSAEILRAIADASGDAEQALQRIAEITARLFDCQSVR